jgi:hypothetical protein
MIWVSCLAPFIPVVLIALWGKIELFFRRLKRRFFPKKKQEQNQNQNKLNETNNLKDTTTNNSEETTLNKNKIE